LEGVVMPDGGAAGGDDVMTHHTSESCI